MQAKGVPLASNQVQYSLLYREPERNGVKKAVEDVGATLVAYSPLNQGLLTGEEAHTVLAAVVILQLASYPLNLKDVPKG